MKYIAIILIILTLLIGCAKTIEGITYDTYGLFNKDEKQNPNIQNAYLNHNSNISDID